MPIAALGDSGKPPSRRRYSIGAERSCIGALADWESRLPGSGTPSVSSAALADWESRLPGGGTLSVSVAVASRREPRKCRTDLGMREPWMSDYLLVLYPISDRFYSVVKHFLRAFATKLPIFYQTGGPTVNGESRARDGR